jgi:hypothetical protein
MEIKIRMISSASKAISFIKQNPLAIDEEAFQYISDFISDEDVKEEKSRRGMIASASHAIRLTRKNPLMSEKDILRIVMEDLPALAHEIEHEDY